MESTAPSAVAARRSRFGSWLDRLQAGDAAAYLITVLAAVCIVAVTGAIAYEVWIGSALSRQRFGWGFLWSNAWDPYFGNFGALPFVYGTLLTSAVAMAVALPLGLGAAIFLAELAPPWVSSSLAFASDLLAAVPSVIYGLLGVFVVIPWLRVSVEPWLKDHLGFLPLFRGPAYGIGFLAAGVILTIMIAPYIISVSREVLLVVPRAQREAALALGATRWEATWRTVVPYARTGILGSVFLALGRALGETMAVTMVIGNTPIIAASLFSPGYTIAAVIANEFTEATDPLHLQALVELGLVLFLVTFLINGLARLLIVATSRKGAERA